MSSLLDAVVALHQAANDATIDLAAYSACHGRTPETDLALSKLIAAAEATETAENSLRQVSAHLSPDTKESEM